VKNTNSSSGYAELEGSTLSTTNNEWVEIEGVIREVMIRNISKSARLKKQQTRLALAPLSSELPGIGDDTIFIRKTDPENDPRLSPGDRVRLTIGRLNMHSSQVRFTDLVVL
jgi:hypothetical protein